VKLDGKVDALVFSGGIGEKSAYLRAEIIKRIQCLGYKLDAEKNNADTDKDVWDIESSGVKILVCKTDEEAEMARTVLTSS
jgi:acetate kinase